MNDPKPNNDESNLSNEPQGLYFVPSNYHPNSLRISTFEELELENLRYSLNLKPIERWKYLHHLNLNAFGKETELLTDFGRIISIKK